MLSFQDLGRSQGLEVSSAQKPVVCVQGLGFVGIAMALAVASARDKSGAPHFNVIGVDLPDAPGKEKVTAINSGHLPFESRDPKMAHALEQAFKAGNFFSTTNADAYRLASVSVVDIHLDVTQGEEGAPAVDFSGMRAALRTLAERMPDGALILIETTVPPGTCEKVAMPEIQAALKQNGRAPDSLLLAHSYERVMPGEQYFDSIVNFWRVFAGYTEKAADACESFLKKVINVKDFPLTRLGSCTASEMAKVLENSYRAVNIAFAEEWGRFGEAVGVDMFEIINAIRVRPTHSNLRQPGFGVGGYCLTKDPLLGSVSARNLFGLNLSFPFCEMAIQANRDMPLVSLKKIKEKLGSLKGKKLLILGISYRQDVSDTRYSPSEIFATEALRMGAVVHAHDPLVTTWPEVKAEVHKEIPSAAGFDGVVLAVQHAHYREFDFGRWLKGSGALLFDANHVLETAELKRIAGLGVAVASIGRGSP
ncbi:MAG TPA: nucleotide sugar dehydrogenase [Bdellovibrionota bacterium]|jgi:nucleotide sugar dehydrogenase